MNRNVFEFLLTFLDFDFLSRQNLRLNIEKLLIVRSILIEQKLIGERRLKCDVVDRKFPMTEGDEH